MKLEISNRRKAEKPTNIWKLNSVLLNSQLVEEEIRREIKKTKNKKQNWNSLLKLTGHSRSSPNGKVYSHKHFQ